MKNFLEQHTKSKNRAFPGEDEDESGNELSQGGSNGVRVGGLIGPSKSISSRRHSGGGGGKNSSKQFLEDQSMQNRAISGFSKDLKILGKV